uniref:Annexin-like protein 2 n=2 Tax=Nilaparvata lugens TaxID=108931 RepID=A0A191UR33_NILLU|nr:annexin-like protein 2 [Nilaparvata lugens]
MKLSVIIITCILSFNYGECRPSTGPSIIALPFNAGDDANAIISAMEKSSSDNKDKIVDILMSKTISQRLEIGAAYENTKSDLVKDFKKDIGKYFDGGKDSDKNMLEILKTTPEFLASRINRSVKKDGSDGYLSIIITSSSEMLRNVSIAYKKEYNQEMAMDISKHLGETDLAGFVFKLTSYNIDLQRSDHAKVDDELTKKLVNVMPNTKNDCSVEISKDFYEMMQKESFAQIKAVGELFQQNSGSLAVDTIKKYCDGVLNTPFVLIMNFSMDPFKYFAHEMNEDIKGDNDDEDSACTRILISRSEIDMADIRTAYDAAYENGLESALRKKYKKREQMIMTALANGNQP